MSLADQKISAQTGLAALCLLAAWATCANSASAAETDSPWTLSGGAGAVSNYVTRGLTQTWGGPAAQAEIEAEHDAGFYAGAFTSNVSRNQFPGGGVEFELWTGYEHEFADNKALALEAVYFAYPGANNSKGNCAAPACPSQTFNTFEGRLAARSDWFSTRFSYAFTDYFGASPQTGYQSSTRGTWYWEANAQYPLPSDQTWNLVAHAGYTRYRAQFVQPTPNDATNPNYWDWQVGVTKRFSDALRGWRLGAYYTQASNRDFYDQTRSLVNDSTRNLGGATVIVEIDWAF